MLTIISKNCESVYNILLLLEMRISIHHAEYSNIFEWLGMVAT